MGRARCGVRMQRRYSRPSSGKVLIAVLARENELGNVIEGTLSTWGSSLLTSASILFIVSHTAMHGLGFKKRKDKFMDFDDDCDCD